MELSCNLAGLNRCDLPGVADLEPVAEKRMFVPGHVEPDVQADDKLRRVDGNGLFGLVPHVALSPKGLRRA